MNICHAPSSSATPKPAKASQKWARIIRRLLDTTQPLGGGGQLGEGGLVDDLDPAPHALMPHAAEFVARHVALAKRLEARRKAGDIAGHQHEVDGSAGDQESMNHIAAGHAEGD